MSYSSIDGTGHQDEALLMEILCDYGIIYTRHLSHRRSRNRHLPASRDWHFEIFWKKNVICLIFRNMENSNGQNIQDNIEFFVVRENAHPCL